MSIYIFGGGPTGLAIAHGLSLESQLPFVLIERDVQLGGLSKTLEWENYGKHDLGPHKIYTSDSELMDRVENLLSKNEWLTQPKVSSIHIKGHYLPYPPSPLNLAKVYGFKCFVKMTFDYVLAFLRTQIVKDNSKTFEDDLINRLGISLYKALFEPIALKLWGDPSNLDIKLSQARVQTPSISEIFKLILGRRSSSQFEALEFRYPRGGLQRLWESIYNNTQALGTYLTNNEILAIDIKDNHVSSFKYKNTISKEVVSVCLGDEDFIVSTLPLTKIPEIIKNEVYQRTKNLIQKYVLLNDLILVFLKINKPRLLDESWIFIPDPDIIFHRLSEQSTFDPDMTPDGSIVCCEIMSNKIRLNKLKSKRALFDATISGLSAMGFSNYKVEDWRVIMLSKSYPVYQPGFQDRLDEVLRDLDRLENFRTIGRQGAFNYIGTLDAMDIGYGCARWLVSHLSGKNTISWQDERMRTTYYPVLD